MEGLTESSKSYLSDAGVYDTFSKAEDAPGKVLEVLLPYAKGMHVLDAGCGTGKYTKALAPITKSILGVDQSAYQLELAKFNCGEVPGKSRGSTGEATPFGTKGAEIPQSTRVNFVQADLTQTPLAPGSFDLVISCWVLGTILDEKRRAEAVVELKRVLRPGGCIILVENGEGGEFEDLRGRVGDPQRKTAKYNAWLESQGFNIEARVATQFEFPTVELAQNTFRTIWGSTLKHEPKHGIITHNVMMYQWVSKGT